ncbi:MAG: hypothetical protein PHV05_10915, partial [Candidatus Riflebacteria bacterium]|nr:hypothetical protein [Candidatus Riflebacteria bacterium]
LSETSAFTSTIWSGWLGNTTGQFTRTVTSADGATIYARAKYEDIAGNFSTGWQTSDGIRIDVSNPTANATTDSVAGNNDIDHNVSADANVYFGFSHSDAISGVNNVRIQIAKDTGFSQLVKDQYLGSAVTSYLFSEGIDNVTYYAKIMVKDRAGNDSVWGARSDGIRVDLTPPAYSTNAFYINKKPDAELGESTTATATVHLTFMVTDPSGVASARVSNDGSTWTTFLNPALNPSSYTWNLTSSAGLKTVYIIFTDKVGHAGAPTSQQIEYFPSFTIFVGSRDDRTYPTDTYDEYTGQNKYGAQRSSDTEAPNQGTSLKLVKP